MLPSPSPTPSLSPSLSPRRTPLPQPAPAPTGRPLVVAHRGASGEAPENTLAAARLAVAQGADLVENDLHRTRDGALVVHHDATLARTTDAARSLPGRAPWAIAELTLDEVRRVDAGSWRGAAHAGERVPTLAEWAEAVGPAAGMLLEAKSPSLYPGVAHDLAAELRGLPTLRRALLEGRLVVQSFDLDWLGGFAAQLPDVPVGALTARRPSPAQVREVSRWAGYLNPAASAVEAATVDRIHEAGLRTLVWTVNRGAAMRRAAHAGVDGIITNHPARCRTVLAGHHPGHPGSHPGSHPGVRADRLGSMIGWVRAARRPVTRPGGPPWSSAP